MGLAQLADSLTKAVLHFFSQQQRWRLVHDPKFESGRVHKKAMEKKLRELQEQQVSFVAALKTMAIRHRWPWDEGQDESLL